MNIEANLPPAAMYRYRQMSGRAGRAGLDDHGEAILIATRKYGEAALTALILRAPDPVGSCLTDDKRGMHRALLEVRPCSEPSSCQCHAREQAWESHIYMIEPAQDLGSPSPGFFFQEHLMNHAQYLRMTRLDICWGRVVSLYVQVAVQIDSTFLRFARCFAQGVF